MITRLDDRVEGDCRLRLLLLLCHVVKSEGVTIKQNDGTQWTKKDFGGIAGAGKMSLLTCGKGG